jgi:hypothetical protein
LDIQVEVMSREAVNGMDSLLSTYTKAEQGQLKANPI